MNAVPVAREEHSQGKLIERAGESGDSESRKQVAATFSLFPFEIRPTAGPGFALQTGV